MIRGLKFSRLDYLGAQLAARLAEQVEPGADHDLLVPVPLHWRRRLARGYDQVELIARPLARLWELPYAALLGRHRATPAQSGLDRRQRHANLRRAFRPRRAAAGRRILLFDDVVTTGATMEAAAACLKSAGAAWVTALAVARTPPPEEAPRPVRAPGSPFQGGGGRRKGE